MSSLVDNDGRPVPSRAFHLTGLVLVAALTASVVASCSRADEPSAPSDLATGRFVDSVVDGLLYVRLRTPTCCDGLRPVPGVARYTQRGGIYDWRDGDNETDSDDYVAFYVGPIPLGVAVGGPLTTLADLQGPVGDRGRWSPQAYGEDGSPAQRDPRIINQARFLLALDVDRDPSNGIEIPRETTEALYEELGRTPGSFFLAFDSPDFDDMANAILRQLEGRRSGQTFMLPTPVDAAAHLTDSLARPPAPAFAAFPYPAGDPKRCTHIRFRFDMVPWGTGVITKYAFYLSRNEDPVPSRQAAVGQILRPENTGPVEFELPPGYYHYTLASVRTDGHNGWGTVESTGNFIEEWRLPDRSCTQDAGTPGIDGGGPGTDGGGVLDVTQGIWTGRRGGLFGQPDLYEVRDIKFSAGGSCRYYIRRTGPGAEPMCNDVEGDRVWDCTWQWSGGDLLCEHPCDFDSRQQCRDTFRVSGPNLTFVEELQISNSAIQARGYPFTNVSSVQTPWGCNVMTFP